MIDPTTIDLVDASSAPTEDEPTSPGVRAATVLVTSLTWSMFQNAARAVRFGVSEATHATHHVAASSTEARAQDIVFRRLVEDALKRGRSQWFEDGMVSQLSKDVAELLHEHPEEFLVTLASFVSGNRFNAEVLAEALNAVGENFPEREHHLALWLLEHGLGSAAPHVRDAAALALVRAGDTASVEALRAAAEREPIPSLRRDLLQALEELAPKRDEASARHE